MSDSERPGHQLLCEFHDFERRYDMAKGQLSADGVVIPPCNFSLPSRQDAASFCSRPS
jgi:hypothetical protein